MTLNGVTTTQLSGHQGSISLKHIGGKMSPQLVYFVRRNELLNFSEMAPRVIPQNRPTQFPDIPNVYHQKNINKRKWEY